MKLAKLQLAVLFALLFVLIGYTLPIMWASYAPQSHYIESDSFSAQNATTGDSQHLVCFDRDIKQAHPATVYTELYLVSGDDGTATEVNSRTFEEYFEKGEVAVESSFSLPDDLSVGQYRYLLVIQMQLSNGQVEREFSFTSDEFTIVDEQTNQTIGDSFTC